MASSDEEKKGQKIQGDANPFIAFRRFADEQMSTLINGVFSISSLFASHPPRSAQHYEKLLREARESSQCLAREEEEAERIMNVYTRAHMDGQHFLRGDTLEPTRHDDNGPLRCPYRPSEQGAPWFEKPGLKIGDLDDATRSCLPLPASSLRFPSTFITPSMLAEQLPPVPIAYLLYSPYSPVRLEQQPHLCDRGAKWREAFEDLLAVQNGQELRPRSSQKFRESSLDWVRGMIGTAVLKREEENEEVRNAAGKTSEAVRQHPRLLSRFASAKHLDDCDEDEGGDTMDVNNDDDADIVEIDMYDRLFSLQQPSSNSMTTAAARSTAHLQQGSYPLDTDSRKPSILSTLTTTERTTLQDGSVHTKVVLQKHFSDGREERTETVHHQNAVRHTQDLTSKSIKDDTWKDKANKETKESKASGWFWS